jgi:hypothetical protein
MQKCQRHRHETVTSVLAVATLGDTTQNSKKTFGVAPPKEAKACMVISHHNITSTNFANV